MPRFRVDDDAHNHPKFIMAGDEAVGLWNRAGSFCMAYGTDGFVPDWWIAQQIRGKVKAKRLESARLWHRGAYTGERQEFQGLQGYNFHDWRQDSYEKVEADRRKWRIKKAAQRNSSPEVSPGDMHGDIGEDSRESPGYIPLPNTQRDKPTQVENATHLGNAHEQLSAAVKPEAHQLVKVNIPKGHPSAVTTELRLQASALLNDGQNPNDIAEALRLWTTKGVHPKVLPSLVSEVINSRCRPTPTPDAQRRNSTDAKGNEYLRLAAQLDTTNHQQPALEAPAS